KSSDKRSWLITISSSFLSLSSGLTSVRKASSAFCCEKLVCNGNINKPATAIPFRQRFIGLFGFIVNTLTSQSERETEIEISNLNNRLHFLKFSLKKFKKKTSTLFQLYRG